MIILKEIFVSFLTDILDINKKIKDSMNNTIIIILIYQRNKTPLLLLKLIKLIFTKYHKKEMDKRYYLAKKI